MLFGLFKGYQENAYDPEIVKASNIIVGLAYKIGLEKTKYIDRFSDYLLAGAAATASFIAVNLDKVLNPAGSELLNISLGALVASIIAGMLAKTFSVIKNMQLGVAAQIKSVLENSSIEFQKKGININQLNMDALEEAFRRKYESEMSTWVRLNMFFKKKTKTDDPSQLYLLPLKNSQTQNAFVIMQAAAFVIFIVCAFFYIMAIGI